MKKKFTIRLIKFFYEILLFVFDSVIIPKKEISPNNIIACIRLDAIGDFIIYLSSGNLIPKEYSGMKKILICNENVEELAKSLDIFDEIIGINLKSFRFNLSYRNKIIQKVNLSKIKVILHSTYSRSFSLGDSIVRASKAQNSFGFDGDFINQSKYLKFISDTWYTNIIKGEKIVKMEKERNHEFIEKVSNKKINFNNDIPFLLKDLKLIDESLNNYIVISPMASSKIKSWSIDNFNNLINILLRKNNFKIIVCGTNSEKESIQKLVKNINSELLEVRVGRTLLEFIELIKNAKFLIGNDSSSIHIACMVNTPSICIYGGLLHGRFLPYPKGTRNAPILVSSINCKKNNWTCSDKHNCLNQISVDDVLKTFYRVIDMK